MCFCFDCCLLLLCCFGCCFGLDELAIACGYLFVVYIVIVLVVFDSFVDFVLHCIGLYIGWLFVLQLWRLVCCFKC